jgi:5-methylcytosine-specific restriction endonuclease McrA
MEHLTSTKLCTKCGKPGVFCKDRSTKDGLSCWCKTCRSSKYQEWVESDPERSRQLNNFASHKYYERNLIDRRRTNREAAAENRARDPEGTKKRQRAWYAKNPAKAKAHVQRNRLKDPLKVRCRNEKRRAWKMRVVNTLTPDQWQEVLGIFNNACAYCLRTDLSLTIDHMVPLCKGGAHSVANVVPACQSCNSRKGSRPMWVMLKKSPLSEVK